ncbi:hypothetical protein KC334_g847, partial [Hortaea werneckii]
TRSILPPLLLVALTSALASPFGYASLAHVDYITFILAKSCKLLPVMFLHVTLYGKRYPFYKYGVVALVTAGVALFTLSSSSSKKKSSSSSSGGSGSSAYGLMLLAINLLFDGLTNSTQDDIYARFRPYTGAQMMTALNLLSTGLTALYLLLSPYLLPLLNLSAGTGTGTGADELATALAFLHAHPQVLREVFGFALAGGVGQIFIFATLSHFGSLLLVTVTVTRKMLTMLLSVLWFGHRLTGWQWVGVGLVFGGVGIEGQIGKWEKGKKERERREREVVGKDVGKGKGMSGG